MGTFRFLTEKWKQSLVVILATMPLNSQAQTCLYTLGELDIKPTYTDLISFTQHVRNTHQIPERFEELEVQFRFVVYFVIDEQGLITDIEFPFGGEHPSEFHDNIIKILETAKKFTPGKKNGKPVCTKISMAIPYYTSPTGSNQSRIETWVSPFEEIASNQMRNLEFIPKEFEGVKLGYRENSENICSPLYMKEDITLNMHNSILINTPVRILLKDVDSIKCIIPICIRYNISIRRSLKYSDCPHNMIVVKNMRNNEVYSGYIWDNDPMLQYEHPATDPFAEELEKERLEMIKEAQKYSDIELNEGVFGIGYMNVDILEYVDIPIEKGKYEIFLSSSGLESNHTIVEIVAE